MFKKLKICLVLCFSFNNGYSGLPGPGFGDFPFSTILNAWAGNALGVFQTVLSSSCPQNATRELWNAFTLQGHNRKGGIWYRMSIQVRAEGQNDSELHSALLENGASAAWDFDLNGTRGKMLVYWNRCASMNRDLPRYDILVQINNTYYNKLGVSLRGGNRVNFNYNTGEISIN